MKLKPVEFIGIYPLRTIACEKGGNNTFNTTISVVPLPGLHLIRVSRPRGTLLLHGMGPFARGAR